MIGWTQRGDSLVKAWLNHSKVKRNCLGSKRKGSVCAVGGRMMPETKRIRNFFDKSSRMYALQFGSKRQVQIAFGLGLEEKYLLV
jgi:hypothetical protein